MVVLPQDIQVEILPGITSLLLPRRPSSPARFVGCFPIIFGLFFAGFAVLWILFAAGGWDAPLQMPPDTFPAEWPEPAAAPPPVHHFDPTRLVFGLFGLPFVLGGLVPIYMGLLMLLPSRQQIQITDSQLLTTTRAGILRRTKRLALGQVAKMRISDTFPGVQPIHSAQHIAAIALDSKDGSTFYVASGYPRDIVTGVSEFLMEEFQKRHLSGIVGTDATPVETASDAPESERPIPAVDEPAAEISGRPPGTKITFIPASDTLTFVVPPTGFRGAALGLLLFSVMWNGISWTVGIAFGVAFFAHPSFENFFPLAFIGLFMGIGVVVGLAMLQMAYRRAVFVATADTLIFEQKGPMRHMECQWRRSELKSIEVDYSGTTINDKRLKEMRIVGTDGNKRGLFDGRDEPELEWLAGTLRSFYGLHRHAKDESQD